jgi:hypothetical protein
LPRDNQSQLFEKESEKTTDRTTLFPNGKARVFTGDDFHEDLERIATDKKGKADAKEERKDKRKRAKGTKEANAQRWKQVCDDEHDKEKEAWQKECAALRERGIKKEDLPAAPKRPLKTSVVTAELVAGKEDDTIDADDDEEMDPNDEDEDDPFSM